MEIHLLALPLGTSAHKKQKTGIRAVHSPRKGLVNSLNCRYFSVLMVRFRRSGGVQCYPPIRACLWAFLTCGLRAIALNIFTYFSCGPIAFPLFGSPSNAAVPK